MWNIFFKLCIFSGVLFLTDGKSAIAAKRSYSKGEEQKISVLHREAVVNIGKVRNSQLRVGLSLLMESIPRAQKLIKSDLARLFGQAEAEGEEEVEAIARLVSNRLKDEAPHDFKEEISAIHYNTTMGVARVVVEDKWVGLAGEQICEDIQRAGKVAVREMKDATSTAIKDTIAGLRLTVLELEEEVINDRMEKRGIHVEIIDGELKQGHTIDQEEVLQTTIAEAITKIKQAGQDDYQSNLGLLEHYIQKAEHCVWFDLGSLFGNTVPFAQLEEIAMEVSKRLEFKAYDEVRQKADEKINLWVSEVKHGGKCDTSNMKPKQIGKCVVEVEVLGEHTLEDEIKDAAKNVIDRLRQTALEIEKEVINNHPVTMMEVRVEIVGGKLKEEKAVDEMTDGVVKDIVSVERNEEIKTRQMKTWMIADKGGVQHYVDDTHGQTDTDADGGTDADTDEEAGEDMHDETDNRKGGETNDSKDRESKVKDPARTKPIAV